MRAVDHVDSRCVHLVGIAEADAMEISSNHECGGDIRAVSRSDEHGFSVPLVFEFALYVLPPVVHIGHDEERGL